MKKISRLLMVAVLVVFAILVTGSSISNHSEFEEKVAQLRPDETIRVIVHLLEQPSSAKSSLLTNAGKIDYWKSFCHQSQADLLNHIANLDSKSCLVSDINDSFCISNIVVLDANQKAIESISKHPDVFYISGNDSVYIPEPIERESVSLLDDDIQWNINRVCAPDVWDLGFKGEGQVIAFMDTGQDTSHYILRGRLVPGGWFDAVNDSAFPYDDNRHGTHVSGIAGGTHGYGVAPEVRFVVIKVFSAGGSGTWENIHQGFQWLAENADRLGVRIVSNSWGSYNSTSLEVWPDIINIRELGLIPVFASGNGGSHTSTPGNYPTVIATGSVDSLDSLAGSSCYGPAPNQPPWTYIIHWVIECWNRIVPTISAPGVNVKSSVPGGEFAILSGTSMACPHVAGMIALMLQRDPNLTFKEIYEILTEHNFRLPNQKYPDNKYGWGRADAFEAVINVPPVIIPVEKIYLSIRPNPSSGQTRIYYQLPKAEENVTLSIYNIAGQLVRRIESGYRMAGRYEIYWNGRGNNNQPVNSGVYLCYLKAGAETFSQKLIVLR